MGAAAGIAVAEIDGAWISVVAVDSRGYAHSSSGRARIGGAGIAVEANARDRQTAFRLGACVNSAEVVVAAVLWVPRALPGDGYDASALAAATPESVVNAETGRRVARVHGAIIRIIAELRRVSAPGRRVTRIDGAQIVVVTGLLPEVALSKAP